MDEPDINCRHLPTIIDLQHRVGRLEASFKETSAMTSALRTELSVLHVDVAYIKTGLDGIKAGLNRVLWAIGLSVIAAGMTFILSGGLVIVQK